MKIIKFVSIVLLMLLLISCGIGKKLDRITESIEDVSNAAVSLLDKINDISRLVDSKLEGGEINQDLADLIDGRLQTLSELLESTMQNSGGYFFDRVDGSVDNAFMNLSKLLDQIQTGILENTIPSLINQISSQMQLQINTISASVEDIIILASGEVMVVVDKTVNGIILTFSVILLALTLLIFAIILIRKGRKLTGANYIGLGLIGLFIIFFSLIIFFPKIRGNIISGFDYASKVNKREVTPKITGVVPETIVLGKTKNIYIYGNHLNLLQSFDVKLMQGNKQKFKFPESTIIVATRNRIVLGNLDKNLQWFVPKFSKFIVDAKLENLQTQVSMQKIAEASNTINDAIYSKIQSLPSSINMRRIDNVSLVPATTIKTRVNTTQYMAQKNNLVTEKLGLANSAKYMQLVNAFFLGKYKIAEGDYGLMVYKDTVRIESPQLLSILNPPPPVPKPDIFVMDIRWSGGLEPVAGQSTALDITFGFKHPEQISGPFKAKITSVPVLSPVEFTIPEGKIAAACSDNHVVVTSRTFTVNNPGTYTFSCSVDENNMIEESSETNNVASKTLKVGEELYSVKISSLSYEPLTALGDITLTSVCDASDQQSQNCAYSFNLSSKETKPVDCTFIFDNLKKGNLVSLSASAKMKMKMFMTEFDVNLGSIPIYTMDLDERPTDGNPSKDFQIVRETKYYKLTGILTVTKVR